MSYLYQPGPATANPHHKYGAILQLDRGGDHAIKKTLNNIENLLHDPRVQGHIQVELPANSKGYDVYVKHNGFEKKLEQMKKEGVILAQCKNTLHELHIERRQRNSFITMVPSGVGEITLRESQGWGIYPSGAAGKYRYVNNRQNVPAGGCRSSLADGPD